MIGILIVTHGFLGRAFQSAAEQLLGSTPLIESVDIQGFFDHEHTWLGFKEALISLDQGQGVLVLTDMFGGAPSNLALAGMGIAPIEVVVGLNLPMLLHAIDERHHLPLDLLAQKIACAGQKEIRIASHLLESPCDTLKPLMTEENNAEHA